MYEVFVIIFMFFVAVVIDHRMHEHKIRRAAQRERLRQLFLQQRNKARANKIIVE
jgi:hypothetical protein